MDIGDNVWYRPRKTARIYPAIVQNIGGMDELIRKIESITDLDDDGLSVFYLHCEGGSIGLADEIYETEADAINSIFAQDRADWAIEQQALALIIELNIDPLNETLTDKVIQLFEDFKSAISDGNSAEGENFSPLRLRDFDRD